MYLTIVWCDTIQVCRILSISQASHYNAIMGGDGNSLLTTLDVEVYMTYIELDYVFYLLYPSMSQ